MRVYNEAQYQIDKAMKIMNFRMSLSFLYGITEFNAIEGDPMIHDWDNVKRSWKERLFGRPWQPLQKTKKVFNPKVYQLKDGVVLCSPETKGWIIKGLMGEL